jgi:hypothetical protein
MAHPFRVLNRVAHGLVARFYFETQPERHRGLVVSFQVGEGAAGAKIAARPFGGEKDGLLRYGKGGERSCYVG